MGEVATKAVFFDLFFTLINPVYDEEENEYNILGISHEEWEGFANEHVIYNERALGTIKSGEEIIERIIKSIPKNITVQQKAQLLNVRLKRIKVALDYPEGEIIDTLKQLKKSNIKIGLISNADVIDIKYWNNSYLSSFFDDALFSCNIGIAKPSKEIYELAMKNLNVTPNESIFVGDGGDNELFGAKEVGMKTVLTEFIKVRSDEYKKDLLPYADYKIKHFNEILRFI